MRRPLLLLPLLLISCAANTLLAQESPSQRVQERPAEVPETIIARATSPIVIDGRGNDTAWDAAEKISFIFPWNDVAKESPQSTVVRML